MKAANKGKCAGRIRHASVTPEAVFQGAPYPVHARPTPSIGPLTPPLLLKARL